MDEVYVLTNPITDTIQTIDYFVLAKDRSTFRRVKGMGPYARVESGDYIFAYEMFCITRKGLIMRAIVHWRRRWRRMRRERGAQPGSASIEGSGGQFRHGNFGTSGASSAESNSSVHDEHSSSVSSSP